MLCLSRGPGDRVVIGNNVVVEVLAVRSGGKVVLGFSAPANVPIFREEVIKRAAYEASEASCQCKDKQLEAVA